MSTADISAAGTSTAGVSTPAAEASAAGASAAGTEVLGQAAASARTAGRSGGVAAFARLLGSELGLTFRRPRNLVMLALLALVPVLIGVVVRTFGSDGDAGGIVAATAGNGLMLTFVSLYVLVPLLMPVAVAVVGGDAIAGEANAGTLRYLLTAPAGRTRLLAVKYLNAVVFSLALTVTVAATALITGLALFPVGDVTLLSGTTVTMAEGLLRTLLIVGYVTAGMAALAAVAMALSTLTEIPIGAVAGTVVLIVVTQVLRAIPQLDWLAPYLLPTRWTGFDAVLRDPVATSDLGQGLLAFCAYTVLFGSLAWARFTSKDITS
ncbi:ABC transporter permease [Thermoactinospora rubra]|uniref:ABC transporter permease n=1 Tax=Thermoactinospora rubra TaxID=1088767 RepID=UPI000A11EF0E|nr:ABC transporter permease [Thermoactinospora rubra]